MASTYVNDLRLEEMATGDQSGTWGTTTNTNLELIGEALGYGTEGITTNADTHTTTVADGTADPGRAMYIKYTGTLDSACTITIAPNTLSRVHFIENATSGSQSIIISQGSGANVTIGTGAVKMVYLDGAGSGAAVVDALVDLDLTGTTTVATLTASGVITGTTLEATADTSSGDNAAIGYTSAEGLILTGQGSTNDVTIKNDADADVISIPTGTTGVTFAGAITGTTATLTTADNGVQLNLTSTDADANVGPRLVLQRDSGSPADNDLIGQIEFYGENDNDEAIEYARIYSYILDASDGAEDGALGISTKVATSTVSRIWINSTETVFNENSSDLDFRVESDTVASALFVDGATGYVSTGSLGTSNTRLGVNAGDAIASGGNYNVVIGDEAGTALTTGDGNVAVGFEALATEDADGNNTAVGYQSLKDQNAGATAENTAIGYQAGANVTEGIYNTLVGASAGDSLTHADYNTGLGTGALGGDTLGSKSTAVGYAALFTQNFTTSTDTHNTAIGYAAGTNVTTGKYSTLIGSLAGDAMTTANSNVVVGYSALSAETSGANCVAIGTGALTTQNVDGGTNVGNTAVGYDAGYSMTSGIENTIIGAYAGDALTDADYNVAVGKQALTADTKGNRTTAVGFGALQTQNFSTSTDSNNTALGFWAGKEVTTGVRNTLVGSEAGDTLTVGNDNVVLGAYALDAGNTDSQNVAIGAYALNNQVGGGTTANSMNNTAVGYNAGRNLTSGYYNTFIGNSVATAGTVTGTNNTMMGYLAGYSLSSGDNNLCLGKEAGRTGSPGGNITTGDNTIVLGDENISSANIQVDWTVASDERDKADFTALNLGLDFVKAMKPYTFKWDKRSKYGDKHAEDYDLDAITSDGTHKEDWLDLGFKAQDVKALEEASNYKIADKTNLTVSITDDGKQYGMKYAKLVPILVKAIQELEAEVTKLKGE